MYKFIQSNFFIIIFYYVDIHSNSCFVLFCFVSFDHCIIILLFYYFVHVFVNMYSALCFCYANFICVWTPLKSSFVLKGLSTLLMERINKKNKKIARITKPFHNPGFSLQYIGFPGQISNFLQSILRFEQSISREMRSQ